MRASPHRPISFVLTILLVASAGASHAQDSTRPEHDLLTYEVVYHLPAMDKVTVERDVVYKKVADRTLAVDLYYPPDYKKGRTLPAVVFINGVGDEPGMRKLKEWGQYRSWPRLVAARGMIGIAMEARSGEANAEDVRDVLRWARTEGGARGIDPARTAAWACSANVGVAVPVLMAEGDLPARAAVLYYGSGQAPSFRKDLPVLLVRAGRDQEFSNTPLGQTLNAALAANAPWTMINLPNMHHAFDCLDDNDEARAGIGRTLEFLEGQLLSSAPQPLPAPASARPVSGTPKQARDAMAHFFGREWEEAEKAYTAWVGTHPDDGEAWTMLGRAQAEAKHPEGARVSLKRAIELSPNTAGNYATLGKIEAESRNYDAAVSILEKAIRLMPDDGESHHQLGGVYLTQKRYPEAVRELEEAVRLAPWNGYAWYKLGVASLATENPPRAVESFEHVLQQVPRDPGVLYNMACAQARAGRTDEALDTLGRSIDNGYKDRKNMVADPDLASLRTEPRFAEYVKKLPE